MTQCDRNLQKINKIYLLGSSIYPCYWSRLMACKLIISGNMYSWEKKKKRNKTPQFLKETLLPILDSPVNSALHLEFSCSWESYLTAELTPQKILLQYVCVYTYICKVSRCLDQKVKESTWNTMAKCRKLH